MKLTWTESPGSWDLIADVGCGVYMAFVMCKKRGVYEITHWTSIKATEPLKKVEFNGTLEEAKAYAVALARLG